MRRIAYKPRIYPTHKFCASDPPLIRTTWRSGGFCGISTNSLAEALAWVAEARALGLSVSHVPDEAPEDVS